jgi:uncharacterized protein YegL
MAPWAILAVLLAGDPLAEIREVYRSAAERTDYAAAARAADEIARTGGEEALAFLRSEYDKATQPPLRRLLFRALTLLDRPDRKDFLLESLGAEEPFFRATALEALFAMDRDLAREKALILLDVDEDPRVRGVAADVLGEARGPRACGALLRAALALPPAEQSRLLALLRGAPAADLAEVAGMAAAPDPRARALALVALSGGEAEPFKKLFEEAKKDLDPVVALAGAAALDHLKTPGRSPSVREVLARVKKADDRYRLYEILASLPLRDEELTEALRHAATSGPEGLRPRAAETLGRLAGEEAVATLAPLLRRGTPWTLSVGAARGLALTRCAAAVDALIAGLEGARGRLAHEIAAALESLTGQAFGLFADLWGDWWRQHGGGFQVGARAEPRWEEPRAFRDRYAFYGVEIRSEAVVFVLDVSGSMGGEPLKKLKQELSGAIRAMPETARFNLIPFHDRAYPWSKNLVHAKANGKKAAAAYVEKLQVGGATNLWDGLEAAIADPQVDTIVVLSDGEPNMGEVTGMGAVRRRFLEENRERMILVHAVAIGMSSPELKAMAELTGGTYRQR